MDFALQFSALRALQARYAPAEALLRKPGPSPEALPLDGGVLSHALRMGKAGLKLAVGHHGSVFASTQGADLPALRAYRVQAQEELETLEHEQKADTALRSKTNPTISVKGREEEGTRLSGWELSQIIMCLAITFGLMAIALRSMSLLLEMSGLEVFAHEETANRFLYSAVLLGLPMAVKMLHSFVRTDSSKRTVAWVIAISGILAGLWWSFEFARAFGGNMSTEMPDFSTGGESDSGGTHGGTVLTWASIVAEALLASACWIHASELMEKHKPKQTLRNPAHIEIERRMTKRSLPVAYLIDISARLESRIEATVQACTVFVNRALAKLKNTSTQIWRDLLASEELEALSEEPEAEEKPDDNDDDKPKNNPESEEDSK